MNEINSTPGNPSFMGGLLDWFGTPAGQGLLTAAGASLAGARRGQPLNALGTGLLGGLQGYGQAQQQQLQQAKEGVQNKLLDLQLKQAQQAQSDDDAIRALAQKSYTAPTMTMDQVMAAPGQAGPTIARTQLLPNTQGKFDTQGFVNGVMGVNPLKGMQLQAAMEKQAGIKDIDPNNYTPPSLAKYRVTKNFADLVPRDKKEVAPGGQVYNPYTVQEGTYMADPNKPVMIGNDGQLTPNVPYQTFELQKARAGKTDVNVKNDVRMGESLAGQIGPMVKDTYTAAQGAVQTADAANRVIKAIDSGKVIAGPFANGRLAVTQMADLLGVGGRDNAERIANTRQAIRGLAEMTLQGRKAMTGQGAITDSESKLAERALSADINLTAGEIRQLAAASHRASKWTYDQHQAQLGNMRQDPSLVNLSRFYNVAPFPAMPSSEINFEDLK